MRVTKAPPIEFTCNACGAVNAGEPHEFTPKRTMPPTWLATCAFCGSLETCCPKPLLVAQANADFALGTEALRRS